MPFPTTRSAVRPGARHGLLPRLLLLLLLLVQGCGPGDRQRHGQRRFTLDDFYAADPALDARVEAVFASLSPAERLGQMIVTSCGAGGKAESAVAALIQGKAIGGVLLLGGGKEQLSGLAERLAAQAAAAGGLPLLFSADAEPSLINRRIPGTATVPATREIATPEQCRDAATIISRELLAMHIRQNYAPVVDLDAGNEAIRDRSFGSDEARVLLLARTFVEASSKLGVATTAKHFPGHGLVRGDTHHQLAVIEGETKESRLYEALIRSGITGIMVGHIAVANHGRYDTAGLPASCSRTVVTDWLRGSLGFRGVITTDAMNMGALKQIEQASLKAMEAGCDLILMEPDEPRLLQQATGKYAQEAAFRRQIDDSVKRILRLKICLSLIAR